MPYLLDTDIVVDHLLDAHGTRYLLDAMADEGLAMSVVTYMEAYEGACLSDHPRRLAARFERLVEAVPVVPFTRATARRCARLRAGLRKRGSRVRARALDLLNAATAIEGNCTLVTRNIDDYKDIPGLKLYRNAGSS
jgi:tRNA(fMet)-specific endonuclease VapC